MKKIISLLICLMTVSSQAGNLPDIFSSEVSIANGGIYTVTINQPAGGPIWRVAAWGHINSDAAVAETMLTGWVGDIFTPAQWDGQITFETGTPGLPIFLFTSGVPEVTDFVTLFGPMFPQAVVYWNESYLGNPLVATSSNFTWSEITRNQMSQAGATRSFAYIVSDVGDKMICQIGSGLSLPLTCSSITEPDADGDSVPDAFDNCTLAENPLQEDADFDGYGNACDPDLNGDEIVNFIDLSQFSQLFLSNDEVADFNSDGVVNFVDLLVMSELFFMPPGPSAGF